MESFDHWMNVAARSSRRPHAEVPRPPDYAACIDQKRKAQPKRVKGRSRTTDDQLERECEQEYDALRDQVLQLLVTNRWLEGEATDGGITVTDSEVEEAFDRQRKESFPKKADYEKFLESSGQTEQDILLRVRLDLLSDKIRDHVTKGKDRVTDRQIVAYYKSNKARFGQPERRDLRIVLTESEANARRAKAALAAGDSWRSVAKEYSVDPASRKDGGRLRDVAQGQQERALDTAVFAAAKGRIDGPIRTRSGYYLFEVTEVTRASRKTLGQVRPTIRQVLASESQQKALDEFLSEFRKKWRATTECRGGYETPSCENGPEATPAPAPTSRVP